MSSQSTAQKDSSKLINKAVALQSNLIPQIKNDPLFIQRQGLAQQIVENPQTFGPEQRALLFQQQSDLANQAATDFTVNSANASTGASGAGARSGSQELSRQISAAGLGQSIAQAQQQVALAGAQQDRADLLQAINTASNQVGFQFQPEKDLIATQLGGAKTFAGFGPEQQGIGGILGGLAGSVAGKVIGK